MSKGPAKINPLNGYNIVEQPTGHFKVTSHGRQISESFPTFSAAFGFVQHLTSGLTGHRQQLQKEADRLGAMLADLSGRYDSSDVATSTGEFVDRSSARALTLKQILVTINSVIAEIDGRR